MNNPIITVEDAHRLNLYFQQKVDPRLFLFCNYEPTLPRPISEDGAFYVNVQDLYKFAIDSGCIIKRYRYLADKKSPTYQYIEKILNSPTYQCIEKILGQIETLRSILDHNQSEINGRLDRDKLSSYTRWMTSVIGKDIPESLQDFQSINHELESMATSLLSALEKFVDQVGSSPNKQLLVNLMINQIIYWYSHNTKTRIYEGQLQDAYLSRASAAGRSNVASKPSYILRIKVGKWIEAAQLFVYDKKRAELETQREGIQASLTQIESPGNPFSALISAEKRKELSTNLKLQLEKCSQDIEENKKERAECYKKINGKPYDYLLSLLSNQLAETMKRLDEQGIPYTLLPQDLMQEDIEYRFAGVASPEFDF